MTKPEQENMQNSPIQLPRDQYAHDAAPTEWWWHIGTSTGSDIPPASKTTIIG